MSELLEVGDVLTTSTCLGTSNFPITRVTKTLAKSLRESDGFEHTFKRAISVSMSHPSRPYCTVSYTVKKLIKEDSDNE